MVLKPDAGQRGSGVAIVRSEAKTRSYLETAAFDVLLQEYAPGEELGVFYVRRPDEERGRIFSITEKKLPFVTGDGVSTIERLILVDPRAVAIADGYLRLLGARRDEIPRVGEQVRLVDLGNHCRGAIFLDGTRFATDALERRIDRISSGFEGFFFGRYDLFVAEPDALAAGGGFKIVELNGVTSEATHIYDPRHSLIDAWKTLFRQWRLAFEIGSANRDAGHPPTGLFEIVRLLRAYGDSSRTHPR